MSSLSELNGGNKLQEHPRASAANLTVARCQDNHRLPNRCASGRRQRRAVDSQAKVAGTVGITCDSTVFAAIGSRDPIIKWRSAFILPYASMLNRYRSRRSGICALTASMGELIIST
jgi:hypothetical protein